MMMPVPTWWDRFVAGEPEAFACLIEAHQAHVYAVAFATVCDRELAEDVAQDVFLAAYTQRAQVRDPAALARWLATIARNRGRDVLRRRRRELLADDVEATADLADETADREREAATVRAEVHRALAAIPARYREVLVLHYAEGQSAKAIADALGLSEAATLQR